MGALAKLVQAAPRYLELLNSQYWSAEKLNSYREQHLRRTLALAAKIPFYLDRLGSAPRAEDFSRFPILRRRDVDSLCRSVRSVHPAGPPFAHAASTGTSGPRADFLFDRSHQRGRYAARARYLRANGWNPIQRSVWLAGAGFLNPSPSDDYEDMQFVSRVLVGVRFLANSTDFLRLATAIAEIDPLFIYVYPSVLDGLLRAIDRQRLRLPSLRRVFCGAEVLDESVRDRARRQLGVDIRENYGSTEAFIAWHCPAGNYHQNAEHVFVELLDDEGHEAAPGHMGRVVLTTLENGLMPLLRYEIGDYAIAAEGVCKCGRTLPLMGRVVGRGMNLFRDLQGRLFTTWDLVNVFVDLSNIDLFQIVQTDLDRILVKYVADAEIGQGNEHKIRAELIPYLDPKVRIDFERVTDIPRMPGGKFMVTLSEVTA
jgi:phenylacetate-coenzyme A ligase PaaK-like adenylate-forming protein